MIIFLMFFFFLVWIGMISGATIVGGMLVVCELTCSRRKWVKQLTNCRRSGNKYFSLGGFLILQFSFPALNAANLAALASDGGSPNCAHHGAACAVARSANDPLQQVVCTYSGCPGSDLGTMRVGYSASNQGLPAPLFSAPPPLAAFAAPAPPPMPPMVPFVWGANAPANAVPLPQRPLPPAPKVLQFASSQSVNSILSAQSKLAGTGTVKKVKRACRAK